MITIGQAYKVIANEYSRSFSNSAGDLHMMHHVSINGSIADKFLLHVVCLKQGEGGKAGTLVAVVCHVLGQVFYSDIHVTLGLWVIGRNNFTHVCCKQTGILTQASNIDIQAQVAFVKALLYSRCYGKELL